MTIEINQLSYLVHKKMEANKFLYHQVLLKLPLANNKVSIETSLV